VELIDYDLINGINKEKKEEHSKIITKDTTIIKTTELSPISKPYFNNQNLLHSNNKVDNVFITGNGSSAKVKRELKDFSNFLSPEEKVKQTNDNTNSNTGNGVPLSNIVT